MFTGTLYVKLVQDTCDKPVFYSYFTYFEFSWNDFDFVLVAQQSITIFVQFWDAINRTATLIQW
jgi:hypothetical protein